MARSMRAFLYFATLGWALRRAYGNVVPLPLGRVVPRPIGNVVPPADGNVVPVPLPAAGMVVPSEVAADDEDDDVPSPHSESS